MYSRRWVARGLSTVFAISMVAALGFILMKPVNAQTPGCGSHVVIGARGSGEAYSGPYEMGGTAGRVAEAAAEVLPGSTTRFVSLQYPAAPVLPVERFFDSLELGTFLLRDLVRETLAECPGVRIGLISYSQGAGVVSEALRFLTPVERNGVRAVALVADPFATVNGDTNVTTTSAGNDAPRNGVGILDNKPLPTDVQARSTDWCIFGDLVCAAPRSNDELVAQSFLAPVHAQYEDCCVAFPIPDIIGRGFGERLAG